MPYYEDIKEFRERMSCPDLTDGREFLFENGGVSTGLNHSDPPSDPIELLENKIRYQKLLLEQSDNHQSQIVRYVQDQNEIAATGYGANANPKAFDDLKKAKAETEKAARVLEEMEAKLKELIGPRYLDYHEQQMQIKQQQSREDADRLRDILSGKET